KTVISPSHFSMNRARTDPPLTPPRRGPGPTGRVPLLGGAGGGFMVPMHGKNGVGALHEPYEFRVRTPFESGGGPPHSKTLARWPRSPEPPPGFGVRRP